MTDRTIGMANGKLCGDYFSLKYLRQSSRKLDYYLDQFNPNDYYIFKYTSKQRQVTIEELLEFKHAGYVFFKKDKYDIDYINNWINYYYNNIDELKYLIKPLPPFEPDIIKIKQ